MAAISPRARDLEFPVFLLRTRSQGEHDAYENHLSNFSGTFSSGLADTDNADVQDSDPGGQDLSLRFLPESAPVLEHGPNDENVFRLEQLLRSGRLKEEYGGMIFTSQRAVEIWADVVRRVEQPADAGQSSTHEGSGMVCSPLPS
jgi:hypothetical protein